MVFSGLLAFHPYLTLLCQRTHFSIFSLKYFWGSIALLLRGIARASPNPTLFHVGPAFVGAEKASRGRIWPDRIWLTQPNPSQISYFVFFQHRKDILLYTHSIWLAQSFFKCHWGSILYIVYLQVSLRMISHGIHQGNVQITIVAAQCTGNLKIRNISAISDICFIICRVA